MIEIKNVNKYFNKGRKNEIHAINNTSLTLPNSGLVALLGESGCGKTTMLNAIGGLDKVRSGKIVINGQTITRHSMSAVDRIRNLSIGYIFQDYKLIEDMSVYDNVALALKMVGIKDAAEQKIRVEYVLDKVGILRYRKRPAGTLSGGERQRVGIARALVKNPDIILADEPTGNLDSKNSVEIMNIIKKISKDRLVILVTHEQNLAKFYADRIIEVVDGSVKADYENSHDDALDYEIDNVFYLKDFESHSTYLDKALGQELHVYSNDKENLEINVIVKNGNIYIQSKEGKNVEVIDENSGIDVIDDFKQNIKKDDIDDYDFDLSSVGNQNIRKRYSSIFNLFTGLAAGFKKIFGFSLLRKLLLLGFAFVGVFIIFAVGRVGAVLNVDDSDYIDYNTNYILLERKKITTDEIEKIEAMEGVDYVLTGNSKVALQLQYRDYYQTLERGQINISGSLASTEFLDSSMVVFGRLPENEREVVLDKRLVDSTIFDGLMPKMCGILDYDDVVGRMFYLNANFNDNAYEIVGIVDSGSPSIYAAESQFQTIITYSYEATDENELYYAYVSDGDYDSVDAEFVNYKLYENELTLATKDSRFPEDYEVLVSESLKDSYKIGKTINVKVNGKALTVSGYYKENDNLDVTGYFVNENTVRYNDILNAEIFTICSKSDLNGVLAELQDEDFVAYGTLENSRTLYNEERADTVKSTFVAAAVILVISAIEMYLMTRSSFLSRIKEVGTLRAIGAKKTDIYKMFMGEATAITTLLSLPSMLLMFGVETFLCKKMEIICGIFYMPIPVLILTIICVYLFNIASSLIPVWNTMRKRPAAILARFDVD